MGKSSTGPLFRCAECGWRTTRWSGRCGECQAWGNLNWGKQGQTTTVNPSVQQGWNTRNWDWQFSAGVQHEIVPKVSVDVSYSRRWWGNFFVTHNRAITANDWDQVTLTAPIDSASGSIVQPFSFA